MGSSKKGKNGCIPHGPGSYASNAGFTLLEILVAISILAISLVVILQLFSGGLKSRKVSDDYTRGVFHAREKMSEILLSKDLAEGESGGEFPDSFRWVSLIKLVESGQEEEEKLPFKMFDIQVEILWDAGRSEKHFQVSTIKIVEKEKDGE